MISRLESGKNTNGERARGTRHGLFLFFNNKRACIFRDEVGDERLVVRKEAKQGAIQSNYFLRSAVAVECLSRGRNKG